MKKLFFSIVAGFLLTSCSYFEVKHAINLANNGDYVPALSQLSRVMANGNKSALENFELIYPQAEAKYIEDVKNSKDINLRRYTKGLTNILAIRDIYLGISEPNKRAMHLQPPSVEERVFLTTELAKSYDKLGQMQAHFTYPEKLRAYGLFKEAEYYNSNRDKNITARYEKAKRDATGIFLLNIVDSTRSGMGNNLYSTTALEINKYPLFRVGNNTNYNIEFYITLSDFEYLPSVVKRESGIDTFEDTVTQLVEKRVVTTEKKDGKEIQTIKVIPAYEDVKMNFKYRFTKYKKTSYLSFNFGYDVREKNGNLLYTNRKTIKVEDSVEWKECYPLNFFTTLTPKNFPKSEPEKFTMSKENMIQKAKIEMENYISQTLEKLDLNKEIDI